MPVPKLPPAGVNWMPNTSDLTPPKAVPYLDFGAMSPAPWFDFSGWLEPFFPQPGAVLVPKKGQPVPAPGNPASEGGSQTPGAIPGILQPLISFLTPSASQKRDIAVYGLVFVVFVIAVVSILK
jgi:hypothetical protein